MLVTVAGLIPCHGFLVVVEVLGQALVFLVTFCLRTCHGIQFTEGNEGNEGGSDLFTGRLGEYD